MYDNVYIDNGKGAVVKFTIRGTASGFELDRITIINGSEASKHIGVYDERAKAVVQAQAEVARVTQAFFAGLVPV